MPIPRSESHDAHTAPQAQQFREQLEDEAAPRDETTLKFEGRMAVSDEDAGGDPYNRTGRFRRTIR